MLRGEVAFSSMTMAPLNISLLPANERRRMTPTLRLSLAVLEEFTQVHHFDPLTTAYVFASSCGDVEIACNICRALTEPGRPVSPTQFHNSVHNAAAGYSSIALKSNMPSTTISAFDSTFAAGLLEMASFALAEKRAVLLVAYDQVPAMPVATVRKITCPFAAAILISPGKSANSLCEVTISLNAGTQETTMDNATLESIRTSNPAARALPILKAIADRDRRRILLAHLDNAHIQLDISPCS